MASQTGLERLIDKMNDLAFSIDDMNEHRRKSNASAGHHKDMTTVKSVAKIMLSGIDESMVFFRRQTEIIEEVSPLASEDLESMLEECEDLREEIKSKFEELIDAGETTMSPHVLDVMDDYIKDVMDAQESVLEYVMFAHKCFVGASVLVAQDDHAIIDASTKQSRHTRTKQPKRPRTKKP